MISKRKRTFDQVPREVIKNEDVTTTVEKSERVENIFFHPQKLITRAFFSSFVSLNFSIVFSAGKISPKREDSFSLPATLYVLQSWIEEQTKKREAAAAAGVVVAAAAVVVVAAAAVVVVAAVVKHSKLLVRSLDNVEN